jgi:hypothetical protein
MMNELLVASNNLKTSLQVVSGRMWPADRQFDDAGIECPLSLCDFNQNWNVLRF